MVVRVTCHEIYVISEVYVILVALWRQLHRYNTELCNSSNPLVHQVCRFPQTHHSSHYPLPSSHNRAF